MSSALLIPKRPPLRDARYLELVRKMPCVLTGASPCDPAHTRFMLGGGASMKPGDDRVLPLAHNLHRMQHDMGEMRFWRGAINGAFGPQWIADDLLRRSILAYARERYRATVGHAGGDDG